MPLGHWLVVLGRNHDHVIELDEVRHGPFKVLTRNLDAARAAAQDMPIGEARLYSDRHQLRSKRHVRLVIRQENELAHIEVKHADPALEAFDTWPRAAGPTGESTC